MNVMAAGQRPARSNGSGRIIHLPVAPQVTARTRFASALPSRIDYMMPHEALDYLERVNEEGSPVAMIAISGPGDPLGVPDTTIKTFELVRARYPRPVLAVRTLGIGAERFAAQLAAAGVEYVEMVVNGVKAETIEKLYAWIRPGQKTLKIGDAAELLIREQKNGVSALKFHNISVSISTTLYPGFNHRQVSRISRIMMELGADSISILPYRPDPGSEVVTDSPDRAALKRAKRAAAEHLELVEPLLAEYCAPAPAELQSPAASSARPTSTRPNVAVLSSNGVDVDMHLGKASRILIYGPRADGLTCLLGTREAPPPGGGAARWHELAAMLDDCFAVLAAQAGQSPRSILAEHGLTVITSDDQIDGLVDVLYGGSKKKK